MKQRNEYTGWAVEWKGPKDAPFLVGRYWFQDGTACPSRSGHKIALFETRREAREAAAAKSYGRYRVFKVRVKVTRARDQETWRGRR